MSQVNLLPPELRQASALRQRTLLVAAIAGAVLLAILLFWGYQMMRLNQAQDELAAQEATNQQLNSQIMELQKYGDLQAELQAKEQLYASVYSNEISWSGVLLDVSRVIPADAYLSSFTGTTTDTATTETTATGGPALVGNMSFSGTGAGTDTLATWLTDLDRVKGWVNAWLSSAQETGAFSRIYTFSSGVDLSSEAVTKRGQGAVQP